MKTIKPAFWLANVLEAGERLAYFGIRAILPLMMVLSPELGGLGLDYVQKGLIFGIWALLQCLIPMVSGGFTETFGYKKSLIVAFGINLIGYTMLANILHLSDAVGSLFGQDLSINRINFVLMLVAGCTVGIGTAIFKPPVQGVVAKSLNETNSGIGFGLFYFVVNVGGFLAPMCAGYLRGTSETPTWNYVFWGAAIVTVINLLVTAILFREPERTKEEIAASKKKSAGEVFVGTLKVLWNDKYMLIFLLIVSGFWLMFMQLWDLLPNFLDEWVDRRVNFNPDSLMGLTGHLLDDGAIKPEMVLNINSATIILLVIPLSALFARYRMMTALITGMIISVIGFVMSGMSSLVIFAAIAIFTFSIGEIICSPKFNEYIGMTAPADKKAIYMGYSNIPFAIGWFLGNVLSGPLYQLFSSKEVLAKRWLSEQGAASADLEKLDLPQTMVMMQEKLTAQTGQAVDVFQANDVLWQAYNPWIIWIFLGTVGAASMVGMIAFYFKSGMHKKDSVKTSSSNDAGEISENADLSEISEESRGAEDVDSRKASEDAGSSANDGDKDAAAEIEPSYDSDDSNSGKTSGEA